MEGGETGAGVANGECDATPNDRPHVGPDYVSLVEVSYGPGAVGKHLISVSTHKRGDYGRIDFGCCIEDSGGFELSGCRGSTIQILESHLSMLVNRIL